MKKLFKGVFTTVLALGFLAGCNGGGDGTTHTLTLNNYDGTSISTIKVKDGAKAKKPAEPKEFSPGEDFAFRGWFVDADVKVGEEHELFDWKAPVKEDKTLLALWEGGDIVVTFYINELGVMHDEIEMVAGHMLPKLPEDPEIYGYEFVGWYLDPELTEELDSTAFFMEDTDVYPKYERLYIPDERTFHIVGDLKNPALSYINWNVEGEVGVDWDERSYLEKAEDSNLFSIELEIGFRGEFKIKIPGKLWDTDKQFAYKSIREEDINEENVIEGGFENVQIVNAGLYLIEIETTEDWLRVTRKGDLSEDSEATPNPEPGTIDDWGLIGNAIGGWDDGDDIMLTYDDGDNPFYYLPAIKFNADGFKLRANGAWGLEFGSHEANVLPEGFTQATEENEEGETVLKVGGDITVSEEAAALWYSVYFDLEKLVITELSFALRGDALEGTGWDADSEPLVMAEPVLDEETGEYTLTFEGTYTLKDGSIKAKLVAVADGEEEVHNGWHFAIGNADGENLAVTAGEHTVTLTLTVDADFGVTGELVVA